MTKQTTKPFWIRCLGYGLGAVLTLTASGYAIAYVASERMVAAPVTVPADDSAAIQRGNYLINSVLGCKGYHATDLGGRAEVDNPLIGKLWGPNLSAGAGSVTRDFTAADWVRAIRHGVGRDHRRLILMPSQDYQRLSDVDVAAVVAAIKASEPVDRADEGIALGPLGRTLLATHKIHFAFDVVDHTAARPVTAGTTAEHGSCHRNNYAGGPIPGADPSWPPARNLTPHATGLKGWSLSEFRTALRQGRRPDAASISSVMPWQACAGMTDSDIEALYLYLQPLAPRQFGGR